MKNFRYPYTDDILITTKILSAFGENITKPEERDVMKKSFHVDDYCVYEINVRFQYYITFSKGITNNGKFWHVHIDNADRESIGSADITSIQEFNDLMRAFRIKYRMHELFNVNNALNDSLTVYHYKFYYEQGKDYTVFVHNERTNDVIGYIDAPTNINLLFRNELIYMSQAELEDWIESNVEFI